LRNKKFFPLTESARYAGLVSQHRDIFTSSCRIDNREDSASGFIKLGGAGNGLDCVKGRVGIQIDAEEQNLPTHIK
jgi:hypothetical protein